MLMAMWSRWSSWDLSTTHPAHKYQALLFNNQFQSHDTKLDKNDEASCKMSYIIAKGKEASVFE